MDERKFDYGTEYPVVVESVVSNMVIVVAKEINEGFILFDHGLSPLPNEGDKGKIIFERGGLTGGYWQYYPDKKETVEK